MSTQPATCSGYKSTTLFRSPQVPQPTQLTRCCTLVAMCACVGNTHIHTACCFCALAGCVKYSLPAIGGWAFKQSMDATGTDAGTTTSSGDWTRAITACDAKPGCIAISVTGSSSTSVMKSTISGYRNTSTDDPCAGLLERSSE